ncbi:xylulokinase [Janthinobacterium agaricidamnosum]|uniref:Xylulose kinase n=1 Tax=Janthinobacterium agaricidamnosum NBRC 102515 = DSM 9628 TaxID=1349767 RepID=W0V2L4_9BURK|nr:xylulokinase [Janthinobacterium agaricidamnosum]CDG82121.1 xylulokinase [Janthinobacterium agaricidamnosum NBRC 102515 = DSM 9628]
MYLGIDLGTSEVKVLLIDKEQNIVGSAHAPLTISRPQEQWSEQDPASWWLATKNAVGQLAERHPAELALLRGIGLSGQMHGAVLLDADGQVLRPAILWNDVRSGPQCAELERRVPEARAITGNLIMPGFTAPKLLWVAQHEPGIFARTAKVLLPKDYLRYLLTGETISDMSDAAGTMWLDVARRDWSDTMLTACGLERSHMPRLVEGSAPGGWLKPEWQRAWGIAQPVLLAGGAGDNAASAIGMGVIHEGEGFISLGTSGVFFAANAAYRPNPQQGLHTFCHALPGQWHQMGVMLSAASCLRWAVELTHAGAEAQLLAEIEQAGRAACLVAPLFLPYLSGERTPHNNPDASGAWFGLRHDTSRALLGYSVLEGVAFGLRDSYLALQAAGSAVPVAALVGGGSKSRYWALLLASVLNTPLSLHSSGNLGAALGAARLGLLAVDPEADVAAVCAAPPVLEMIEPQADWHAALLPRFERYQALYRQLKPLF